MWPKYTLWYLGEVSQEEPDLHCYEDEVEIVKVVPGAPQKPKFRGVMPVEELEWLKTLGSEARAAFFKQEE